MNDTNWKAEAEQRRKQRRALDLTLKQVADMIGVDPSQVHRWERGKSLPKADVWHWWGDALRVKEPTDA